MLYGIQDQLIEYQRNRDAFILGHGALLQLRKIAQTYRGLPQATDITRDSRDQIAQVDGCRNVTPL